MTNHFQSYKRVLDFYSLVSLCKKHWTLLGRFFGVDLTTQKMWILAMLMFNMALECDVSCNHVTTLAESSFKTEEVPVIWVLASGLFADWLKSFATVSKINVIQSATNPDLCLYWKKALLLKQTQAAQILEPIQEFLAGIRWTDKSVEMYILGYKFFALYLLTGRQEGWSLKTKDHHHVCLERLVHC